MLRGIGRLQLGYSRALATESAIVLHTVPVILFDLRNGEWRTVQRESSGQGITALVRYLAAAAPRIALGHL